MNLTGEGRDPDIFDINISITVENRDLVPVLHQ